MMEINKVYNEDCLETMGNMPDGFVDLTVTSPPYDNLRTYNGYSFDFQSIARELFRVTKDGGVVVWVVGDATIKGNETGTSFKQALYFKEVGFNLWDTMIFCKNQFPPNCMSQNRYAQMFEYMFILSKGKVKTFNRLLRENKNAGKPAGKARSFYQRDCIRREYGSNKSKTTHSHCVKKNLWSFSVGGKGKAIHPAIFPEQLAHDHIVSWSNENDLVYDPFMGSGTTAKMAVKNNRKWIGSEISLEYCNIIIERMGK